MNDSLFNIVAKWRTATGQPASWALLGPMLLLLLLSSCSAPDKSANVGSMPAAEVSGQKHADTEQVGLAEESPEELPEELTEATVEEPALETAIEPEPSAEPAEPAPDPQPTQSTAEEFAEPNPPSPAPESIIEALSPSDPAESSATPATPPRAAARPKPTKARRPIASASKPKQPPTIGGLVSAKHGDRTKRPRPGGLRDKNSSPPPAATAAPAPAPAQAIAPETNSSPRLLSNVDWVVGEFQEKANWLQNIPELGTENRAWGMQLTQLVSAELKRRQLRSGSINRQLNADELAILAKQGVQYYCDGALVAANTDNNRLTIVSIYRLRKNISTQFYGLQREEISTSSNWLPSAAAQSMMTALQQLAVLISNRIVIDIQADQGATHG